MTRARLRVWRATIRVSGPGGSCRTDSVAAWIKTIARRVARAWLRHVVVAEHRSLPCGPLGSVLTFAGVDPDRATDSPVLLRPAWGLTNRVWEPPLGAAMPLFMLNLIVLFGTCGSGGRAKDMVLTR